jgi:hypothetical protein
MKILTMFILSFFFVSCTNLYKGADQPVIVKNTKEKIMFTTCSGMADDWGGCFNKANQYCSAGYHVMDKFQDSSGIRRELTFKCN